LRREIEGIVRATVVDFQQQFVFPGRKTQQHLFLIGSHGTGRVVGEQFFSVEPDLDAVVAAEGLSLERTVIGGFSQGAVMSYALGLLSGRPSPAGIIALSGFIPTVDGFELDLASRAGLPVAIGHGEYDPIIGVEWGREARGRLTEAGLDVTYREYPLPHAVDPGYLSEISRAWLPGVLPPG